MSRQSAAQSLWNKLSNKPAGKWLFSRFVCWKVPYFASISPQIHELRPGYCEVHVKKRRKVYNHLKTVHAIACCNMAEMAAGMLTDVSIPATHRWIPKGMEVEYLLKAGSDLKAVAEIPTDHVFTDAAELPVTVNVTNTLGEVVVRANIRMWVTLRR